MSISISAPKDPDPRIAKQFAMRALKSATIVALPLQEAASSASVFLIVKLAEAVTVASIVALNAAYRISARETLS